MQKIAMIFVLLCITFNTVCAKDTQRKKEKDAKLLQLTKDEKLTDLTESSDGKWICSS